MTRQPIMSNSAMRTGSDQADTPWNPFAHLILASDKLAQLKMWRPKRCKEIGMSFAHEADLGGTVLGGKRRRWTGTW